LVRKIAAAPPPENLRVMKETTIRQVPINPAEEPVINDAEFHSSGLRPKTLSKSINPG
jgi:hypothetical protein